MYKIITYIPESHLDSVKTAMFSAGAGRFANEPYDHCCWQTRGTGQFRPLTGAHPTLGNIGTIASVIEWRVEMLVAKADTRAVISAYKTAHPYETPAYELYALIDPDTL